MINVPSIPEVSRDNWNSVIEANKATRKALLYLTNFLLGPDSEQSFSNITLTDLTADRLISTDSSQELSSVSNLTGWIAGTSNEINVTDDGDGTVTIGIVNPLIVGKGGTGTASLTDHGLLVGSGTDAITALGAATNGQLPIGSTGADPVLAALTGTANQIEVTNGAGSITLSLTGNMDEIAALTPTDGNFIVGNDTTWVAESGDTARTSLGLGTGNSPTFAGLTVTDYITLTGAATYNSGFGNQSLAAITTGIRNNASGAFALSSVTTGEYNNACGYAALYQNTTGDRNNAMGYASLYAVNPTAAGEGERNSGFGAYSGFNLTTGSGNVFFGYKAGYFQTTADDLFIVDNRSRTNIAGEQANALLYGTFHTTGTSQTLRCNGKFGVNTTPSEEIHAVDTVRADTAFNLNGTDVITASSFLLYGPGTLGDGGTTNYASFAADGKLTFHGTATVWDDVNMGGAVLAATPGQQPDRDEFVDSTGTDTGISTYAIAVGEGVDGSFEIPHSYKNGSDIQFHVHWQGITAPTGTDNVQWQLTYCIVDSDEVVPASTTITVETGFDTQYEMKRSDFAAISGSGVEFGDQFVFRLERIAATSDEYGGDALIATVGIHYEIDTVGSDTISSK